MVQVEDFPMEKIWWGLGGVFHAEKIWDLDGTRFLGISHPDSRNGRC